MLYLTVDTLLQDADKIRKIIEENYENYGRNINGEDIHGSIEIKKISTLITQINTILIITTNRFVIMIQVKLLYFNYTKSIIKVLLD